MKRVLCISPQFPPMNAADMQRLRQALPFLPEFGWQPSVMAIDPDCCEGARDPLLLETVPGTVEVMHCGAFPATLTRKVGLGNLGLRSWPHLRRAVNRYLARTHVDLIFFTTTVFAAIAHGPACKRRHGVPFVVDLQDPWRNDYYLGLPKSQRPRKFAFDHWQKSVLEARTMPEADGLVAVSQAYIDTMQTRYPVLRTKPALELPFAALPQDIEVARRLPAEPRRDGETVMLRYIGRGGPDMARAATILFTALRDGLAERPDLFSRLRFEFLGTSYAPDGRGRQTIRPVAERLGVAAHVTEEPDRLPYFAALRSMLDSDGLVILGSDDRAYTASKLYPYLLADRPLLAVFHEASPAAAVLREVGAAELLTFGEHGDDAVVARAKSALARFAFREHTPEIDWNAFERYTARYMTSRLARLFETVCAPDSTTPFRGRKSNGKRLRKTSR